MANWRELEAQYYMKTFLRQPVVLVRGEGARVWDDQGKVYLDMVAGLAVNVLGHAHPAIVEAVSKQARTLIHVTNIYYTIPQLELAELIVQHSCGRRVFFANSGAEANEAAIKLARKYGKTKLDGKYEIITAKGSFHGRTMGALSATGKPQYQESFQPVVPGFVYAEYNNLKSWLNAITDQTCAVMLELVQGEGGVYPATPDFVEGLARLCYKYKLLMIIDEVQTGLGRTGKLFAYEHYNVKPNIVTVAKSLGGGIPCGALLVDKDTDIFTPGDHSTTIGGGGMAYAAGLVTLRLLEEPGFMEKVVAKGNYIKDTWEHWRREMPVINSCRGLGLMLALDLKVPSKQVMLACLEEGLVVNAVSKNAIRILPALNISQEDLDAGLAILKRVLQQL